MNMRKYFTLCIALCAALILSAQTRPGKISGSILDASAKPIQSVSVSLLKSKDSSLVKVAVTGKEGKYEFENIALGNYLVSGTSAGLEKTYSAVFALTDANP